MAFDAKLFKLKRARSKFRNADLQRKEFYEDFSRAMDDGEGPAVRLEKLIKRSKRDSGYHAILFESWLKRMKRMTFAESLNQSVPSYEVMVLTSAERDGRLKEAMEYLAKTLSIQGKTKSIYVMALVSPAFSFVVVLFMFYMYGTDIAPTFLGLMTLDKWPTLPRYFYYVSYALVNYWYLVFGIGALIISLISWSKDNWHGQLRAKIDNFPILPWKKYRLRQGDLFLMSLALLMQSNSTGLKEALVLMRKYASPWMKWNLMLMSRRLTLTPDEPARSLDIGLFDKSVMYRIEDFAERSNFQDGLKKMAIDGGEYTIEKASKGAVFSSIIAIVISASFMLSFSLSMQQLGNELRVVLSKSN